MLPFLKPKPMSAVMIHKMDSDGSQEPLHEEGEPDPGLVMAMEDFMKAHSAKDIMGMVRAFQNAFDIMESEPHIEDSGEDKY